MLLKSIALIGALGALAMAGAACGSDSDGADGDAFCGNGKLDSGETCESCPADCGGTGGSATGGSATGGSGTGGGATGGSGTGGSGGSAAGPVFHGVVTNMVNPDQAGSGVPSLWDYDGQLSTAAGDAMCKKIGGDHICTYTEVKAAEAASELEGIAVGTYWIHRVTATVKVDGSDSAPGPGGRCNDWKYSTNHIADGEYLDVAANDALMYHLDKDTVFTNTPQGHAANATTGQKCGGVDRGLICCKK